jgi:excisionase family DNA binding protein
MVEVHPMDAKTYSTGEAAKRVGVSRQTLHAWLARGVAKPKTLRVGGTTVRLWTDSDIEKAKSFKGTLTTDPTQKKKKKK